MADSTLILMLEDEQERLQRFEAVLSRCAKHIELKHWRTAGEFITGFKSKIGTPKLICLDHDLFANHPDDPDPGDGRDVANYLANQAPCCHVVIHSSNAPAADAMLYTLLDAKWDAETIAPLGKDWIESYWWNTVKPWIFQSPKN